MTTDDPTAARPGGGRASAPARALLGGLCLLAVALLAAGWAARPLIHDDLFGHLSTGQWIVRHHQVPLHDPFSYTRFGERWVSHEWGFSLLAYGIYRAAGYGGLVGLAVALTLGTGAAVARRSLALAREGAHPASFILLGVLLAVGLRAATPELFLRAALAGERLLAASLLLLTRFRQTGARRYLAGLVALFWVWANLHSGVIFGLYLLALFALEALVAERLVPRWPALGVVARGGPARPYLWTLAAALAASLLNPNGAATLLYPLRLSRLLFASGIDWELGQFAPASPRGNLAFALLAALLLAGLLPPRQAHWLSLAELLGLASFFLLSFRSYRLVFDFAILAVPATFTLYSRRRRGAGGRGWAAAVAGLGAAALLGAAAGRVWQMRPPGAIDERFPAAALRFLQVQGIAGHIFNHQNYGGYLGWRLAMPIFWDGRNDVFAGLVREVETTPFPVTVARYGIGSLLITELEYRSLLPELATGRWRLLYWDDFCAIYLPRRGRFAARAPGLDLRLFPPFGGRPGLAALALEPAAAAAARRELDQVLAQNPTVQRALYFKGVISLYRGELERARAELAAARDVRPSDQVELALRQLELGAAPRPPR